MNFVLLATLMIIYGKHQNNPLLQMSTSAFFTKCASFYDADLNLPKAIVCRIPYQIYTKSIYIMSMLYLQLKIL